MNLPVSGEGVLARINLIYVGPLDERHRVRELADAFMAARDRDPRLHLLVAGSGSERGWLEHHLGHAATFLDGLDATALGELRAHADLLISPTTEADTADTILAAQRGGLPVLAVDGGEAATLIENGRSGFLVPDDPVALVDAIRWLARRATLRERLATGGRVAAGARLLPGAPLNGEAAHGPGAAASAVPVHTSEPERIMTA
jgi:glycosyltransferase involved in cell wall biosynthesis